MNALVVNGFIVVPIDQKAYAIKGNILIGREIVEYLCDPGAALTVISNSLYDRMNTEHEPMPLQPYLGGPISSCNLKIKVLGVVNVDRCTLSSDVSIRDTNMIVMENLPNHDCLMCRDVIVRVPSLSQPMEELRTSVNEFTADLQQNLLPGFENQSNLIERNDPLDILESSAHSKAALKP